MDNGRRWTFVSKPVQVINFKNLLTEPINPFFVKVSGPVKNNNLLSVFQDEKPELKTILNV